MNRISKSRHRLIHLYNRKKEGLGTYDFHYINAHSKEIKVRRLAKENQRYLA